MAEISLCMIVKNEEELLSSCLNSVAHLCDEIIIVDTGSTDKTKAIASTFTDKIFDFEWCNDFSAARNFSFKQATKPFIFWLDADDYLNDKDQQRLQSLKNELDDTIDAVSMLYYTTFDHEGTPTFSFRRNRLVKRANQFRWIGKVHEYLEVSGHILTSPIAISHQKHKKSRDNLDPTRNLRIYEQQKRDKIPFSARDLFYYANELKDHQQYKEAIQTYHTFLEHKHSWIEDRIRACLYKANCYRALNERNNELEAILATFKFDLPRPEAACRIGDYYKEQMKYLEAIFWYDLAANKTNVNDMSFQDHRFSTSYPHTQLSVCYWQLNQIDKAYEHHQIAKKHLPANDATIIFNEHFFHSANSIKD